jgi:hypothetical protein
MKIKENEHVLVHVVFRLTKSKKRNGQKKERKTCDQRYTSSGLGKSKNVVEIGDDPKS